MKRTLATAAALLTLTACGSHDDPPASDPRPTFAPSSTKTGPVEPTKPDVVSKKSKAGAIAMAKYYWRVVNYAQASGDTGPLVWIAADTCRSCTRGKNWIDKVFNHGGKIIGGAYSTKYLGINAIPGRDGHAIGYSVALKLSSAHERVTGAGRLNAVDRAKSAPISMDVQYFNGAWEVMAWQLAG